MLTKLPSFILKKYGKIDIASMLIKSRAFIVYLAKYNIINHVEKLATTTYYSISVLSTKKPVFFIWVNGGTGYNPPPEAPDVKR